MKYKQGLSIDIAVTNAQHSSERNVNSCNDFPLYNDDTDTTYRAEGLSIGKDYIRCFGSKMELSPKDLIVEGTIGKGTSSTVKLARYMQKGDKKQFYALKIFPLNREVNRTGTGSCLFNENRFINDDDSDIHAVRRQSENQQRSMLIQEIKTLSRLHCHCLVQMVGAFYDPGMSVTMVLEYMDQGSLSDLLGFNSPFEDSSDEMSNICAQSSVRKSVSQSIVMPEAALAGVAYQMLWGISYLHIEKILHRDIKPANVLVHSNGEIKLGDLGIAGTVSFRNNPTDMSQSGLNHTVIGTKRYMSPERILDRAYGIPSDIWSLGLVLLECATGGWSPFSIYYGNNENSSANTSSRRGPKHRKGIRSIIELAVILEEFSIDSVLEHLSRLEQPFIHGAKIRFGDEVNWNDEVNKANGISELLTMCLQTKPGMYIYCS